MVNLKYAILILFLCHVAFGSSYPVPRPSGASVFAFSSTGNPTTPTCTTANRVLRTTGTAIQCAQADLTTDITGVLPAANGGANSSSAIWNCSIATSVSGNALTVALKDGSGSDPSSSSPCIIGFRNATSTTGTFTMRSVTSATSVTISSGSTLGFKNNAVQSAWVLAFDSGAGVVLGVSGVAFPNNFDEGTPTSCTAEGGAGAADSAGTPYCTASQTSKPVRLIARLTLQEVTAGTWASNASEVSNTPFTTAFVSGTWTPTLSGISNVDGTTLQKARYIRVGNIVTATVAALVDPTAAAATQTEFSISLPIQTTFTNADDCTGAFGSAEDVGTRRFVRANTTNHTCNVTFRSGFTTNELVTVVFQYSIQ